jgi:hypothetical protein
VENRSATIPIPMRLRTAVSVLACICGTGWALAAQLGPERQSPIWSTQVLAELSLPRGGITGFPDTSRAGVLFSDDGHLVVYEVDHDADQPSSRTAEVLRPFFLRLSLLDSASGKIALGKEERTSVQKAAVFATAAGLLVKTGGIRLRPLQQSLESNRDGRNRAAAAINLRWAQPHHGSASRLRCRGQRHYGWPIQPGFPQLHLRRQLSALAGGRWDNGDVHVQCRGATSQQDSGIDECDLHLRLVGASGGGKNGSS